MTTQAAKQVSSDRFNGLNTPQLVQTVEAVKQDKTSGEVRISRAQPVDRRHGDPHVDPGLLRRRRGRQVAQQAVYVHERRAARAPRRERGCRRGRSAAARARELRRLDRGPARHGAWHPHRVDRDRAEGRCRPAGPPRPRSGGAPRLPEDHGQDGRSRPTAAMPSSTSWCRSCAAIRRCTTRSAGRCRCCSSGCESPLTPPSPPTTGERVRRTGQPPAALANPGPNFTHAPIIRAAFHRRR